MNDELNTTDWQSVGMAESYTITVERSGTVGLWYATGSMHKGLIVIGHTMGEALSRIESAWADLRQADEEAARAKAT